MRIRSTDALSRSDDLGKEFLETASKVLDWHAPGRIESFPESALYDANGLDSLNNEAPWLVSGKWPTHPIVIVCENRVNLCQGEVDDTQGIRLLHGMQLSNVSTPSPELTTRRNKGRVYPGGVFVLREDCVWNVDFGQSTTTHYNAPGQSNVVSAPTISGGEIGATYPSMVLDIFEIYSFEQGEALFVGGEDSIEIIYREVGQTSWTRPWESTHLRFGDVSGDLNHKFYDVKVRADGVVFALGYKPGELALIRTNGIFDPKSASTAAPGAALWVQSATLFPSIFEASVASSEVSNDATTRIRPKLVFDQTGALFIQLSTAILNIPDPAGSPDIWSLWAAFENTDLGLNVEGLLVPEGGHILDLAFDGNNPGILQRLNPDTDTFDDVWLLACNQSFRNILWKRRYDEPALGLRSNNINYPQSSVVYLGRTVSPTEGSGPDTEILGGVP